MKQPRFSLPLRFYHGTSSLFLQSICEFGLASKNPVQEWRVLEFGKQMLPLAEEYLEPRDEYLCWVDAFRTMLDQSVSGMNFQHGDTYISPSELTAVRYALNNRFGSEILSYALHLLEALLMRPVKGVPGDIPEQYPEIWRAMNTRPAPLLIEIDSPPIEALRTEFDEAPESQIEMLLSHLADEPSLFSALAQQQNFRVVGPVERRGLRVSLIVPLVYDPHSPRYQLYPLSLGKTS